MMMLMVMHKIFAQLQAVDFNELKRVPVFHEKIPVVIHESNTGVWRLATGDKVDMVQFFPQTQAVHVHCLYLSTKKSRLCVTGTYSLLTIEFDLTRRLGFHMIQV